MNKVGESQKMLLHKRRINTHLVQLRKGKKEKWWEFEMTRNENTFLKPISTARSLKHLLHRLRSYFLIRPLLFPQRRLKKWRKDEKETRKIPSSDASARGSRVSEFEVSVSHLCLLMLCYEKVINTRSEKRWWREQKKNLGVLNI